MWSWLTPRRRLELGSCVGSSRRTSFQRTCAGFAPTASDPRRRLELGSCVGSSRGTRFQRTCVGSGPFSSVLRTCVGSGPFASVWPSVFWTSSGSGPTVFVLRTCVGSGPFASFLRTCVGSGPFASVWPSVFWTSSGSGPTVFVHCARDQLRAGHLCQTLTGLDCKYVFRTLRSAFPTDMRWLHADRLVPQNMRRLRAVRLFDLRVFWTSVETVASGRPSSSHLTASGHLCLTMTLPNVRWLWPFASFLLLRPRDLRKGLSPSSRNGQGELSLRRNYRVRTHARTCRPAPLCRLTGRWRKLLNR